MKAYIITLKDHQLSETVSKDCQNQATKFGIDVEVFDAIWGDRYQKHMKKTGLKLGRIKKGKMTLGHYGNFFSHYYLWLKCIELGTPIIVLEHDGYFIRPIPEDILNNFTDVLKLDFENLKNLIGDPTKLSQILINLINNSIKFTKNGKVTLSVKTIKEQDDTVTLNFIIQDNGIGIPEDKIANIFDSFSQGSVEINRTYGGTGLGLSIVKKIIELLGSEIHLESKENEGTKLYFDLNFGKSNAEIILNHEKKKVTSYVNLKNKTVLLVEDNKINQMITKKMLENKGMICSIIDNGEDAIIAMQNSTFDLVLMDVHLTGINGTEATAEIRKFDKTTPIIALTAISLNENKEMLLSFGMNEVITKPFNPEYFYTVISDYIV